ncbi:MAG: zinc-finger domain-containing protein [Alcaligenaceae bacterium]|nr:zinc-finger domain-containing protein [Alcaligenaceae bacterium]
MPAPKQIETIQVSAKDLPVYCPGPKAPRWSMHPRVFLDVTQTGEATCAYCGAHYALQAEHLATHATDTEPTSTTLAAADSVTSA